ncbi:MAG: rhomboid family intramembrane serine protease [Fuerstiella sp.]|nr:rhomboid family intramembrane serine protease [Fuerstiella sp.]
MSIYDRDVSPSMVSQPPPGASRRPLSIVAKIVLVTIGVFLLQLLTQRPQADSLAFDWLAIERDLVFSYGQVWRLLTYAFIHSETQLLHIGCNMLGLFFLGRIVSQTLGEREFLWVYLVSAVFSGIVQVSTMAIFRIPGQDWALGASGAVCAVFVLFVLHYPRMKLYCFGILPIEARWLLAVAVAWDGLGFLGLVPGLFVGEGAKIGHAAHLGGLAFGFLYFQWNMNLSRWWDQFGGRLSEIPKSSSNLKVYNPGSQPEVDYSTRMDDILAKISNHGEASLTDRERRILTHASEQLKSTRS